MTRIKDSKDLKKYSYDKGNSHHYYLNYSKYVVKNQKNNCFILTNGDSWDDLIDKAHLNKGHNTYAMCFMCQASENVSMWKIYGGDLLKLTHAQICKVIDRNNITVKLFNKQGEEKILKNYSLDLMDILYSGSINNKIIKLTHQDDHFDVDSNVAKGAMDIIKNYAYYNEKECRLILKVNRLTEEDYHRYPLARIEYKKDYITTKNIILKPTHNRRDKSKYNVSILKNEVDFK